MNKVIYILLLYSFVGLIQAQDNILTYVEYDTIRNGYLSLSIDKKMDELLDSKRDRCNAIERARAAAEENDKPINIGDLCREHPKMRGVRIQVINTRSSEEAEEARSKIQSQFPYLSSSVVLRAPQFKVLLGDYFKRENAAEDLDKVKKLYPGAILVMSKIWCARAQ